MEYLLVLVNLEVRDGVNVFNAVVDGMPSNDGDFAETRTRNSIKYLDTGD